MNLHVISPIVVARLISIYHRVGLLFGQKG